MSIGSVEVAMVIVGPDGGNVGSNAHPSRISRQPANVGFQREGNMPAITLTVEVPVKLLKNHGDQRTGSSYCCCIEERAWGHAFCLLSDEPSVLFEVSRLEDVLPFHNGGATTSLSCQSTHCCQATTSCPTITHSCRHFVKSCHDAQAVWFEGLEPL